MSKLDTTADLCVSLRRLMLDLSFYTITRWRQASFKQPRLRLLYSSAHPWLTQGQGFVTRPTFAWGHNVQLIDPSCSAAFRCGVYPFSLLCFIFSSRSQKVQRSQNWGSKSHILKEHRNTSYGREGVFDDNTYSTPNSVLNANMRICCCCTVLYTYSWGLCPFPQMYMPGSVFEQSVTPTPPFSSWLRHVYIRNSKPGKFHAHV